MVLADHGAEVVAVEERRFAADNLFFPSLYRNKKHLCLNLKKPEGREIFLRLVGQADVLIEGFRPGVAKRLGVDFATLARDYPTLIYCSITGYGQTGPFRARAGHDVNYLSVAGILDLIGPVEGPPSIPGVQIGDIAGGAMQAAIGILLAIIARQRTGRGQYIDISMVDGLLGLLNLPLELSLRHGGTPRRSADLLSHRYACYNVYETADQRYVAVGALEKRFWERLCILLELPHLIDLQYEESCRHEVISAVTAVFRQRTAQQWEGVLADEDVCCTVVARLDEVLVNNLFVEREMVVSAPGAEGGGRPLLGIPIKMSDTPGSIRQGPVGFGASSKEILTELGYAAGQVKELQEQGVV
jgi:crotonobetainyl-CoA:carnitine CoA-transferase CaiB-like acyl-CoA transferase